eukprot:1669845-Rhodomonas_salina.1
MDARAQYYVPAGQFAPGVGVGHVSALHVRAREVAVEEGGALELRVREVALPAKALLEAHSLQVLPGKVPAVQHCPARDRPSRPGVLAAPHVARSGRSASLV